MTKLICEKSLKTVSYITGCVLLGCILFLYFVSPSFLTMLNNKVLDTFFRYRGTVETGGQVVIIAIDENSIAQKGRWPWSRVTLSRLVDSLVRAGCAVISLDILFPEPESLISNDIADGMRNSASEYIYLGEGENAIPPEYLAPLIGNNMPDRIFARSLEAADESILGLLFFDGAVSATDKTAEYKRNEDTLHSRRIIQVFESGQSPDDHVFFTPSGYSATTEVISQSVTGEGFLNVLPDSDGVIRRVPLICRYKGSYYPSFALDIVRAYTGEQIRLELDDAGVESLSVGSISPPLGLSGMLPVNYAGPSKTFPYISAVDVIDSAPEGLAGKIALVGLTATGLYDIRTTPFENVYPGIEIHANAIDSMLNSRYLVTPWWSDLAVYSGCVLAAVMLTFLLPCVSAIFGFVFAFGMAVLLLAVSLILFLKFSIWYPPVYPLLSVITIYPAVTLIKFVREERQRRFIKGAFSQYISPQFVDRLVDEPELLKLGGEEQVLTVLFSDIVGFTGISERLSPARLVELLNTYTTEMSDIIMAHGGTIDKYNGDSIMAFFGAPIYFEDHATKACRAAIEMINRINKMQDDWKRAGTPPFFTRIGINTGKMIVGNMGSRSKFNYTVLGDTVNLASRLEGANKYYRTQIIIGDHTYRRLDRQIITRELDLVKVVGKRKPERIFQVVTTATRRYREFLKLYHKGRHFMHKKDFKNALDIFGEALRIHKNDTPTELHMKRCKMFLKNPPDKNWDGSFELHSK